ncbi:hypothetical protein [Achromobacter sp.]|uniref:hypothetical protein n=1 Tax=Achromobacter sp. TaxID=134375 RepID=UPI00258697A5|nr:hypothetical protein [Achromobacter sp.]
MSLLFLTQSEYNQYIKLSMAYERARQKDDEDDEPVDHNQELIDELLDKSPEGKALQDFVVSLDIDKQADLLALRRLGNTIQTPETISRKVYKAEVEQQKKNIIDDPLVPLRPAGLGEWKFVESGKRKLV